MQKFGRCQEVQEQEREALERKQREIVPDLLDFRNNARRRSEPTLKRRYFPNSALGFRKKRNSHAWNKRRRSSSKSLKTLSSTRKPVRSCVQPSSPERLGTGTFLSSRFLPTQPHCSRPWEGQREIQAHDFQWEEAGQISQEGEAQQSFSGDLSTLQTSTTLRFDIQS